MYDSTEGLLWFHTSKFDGFWQVWKVDLKTKYFAYEWYFFPTSFPCPFLRTKQSRLAIEKSFGKKLMKMEPEQEPGFDLNYPVPLLKELLGFSGSGSEPGSITTQHWLSAH